MRSGIIRYSLNVTSGRSSMRLFVAATSARAQARRACWAGAPPAPCRALWPAQRKARAARRNHTDHARLRARVDDATGAWGEVSPQQGGVVIPYLTKVWVGADGARATALVVVCRAASDN